MRVTYLFWYCILANIIFCQCLFKFMAKNIASYEVNCKIQFTKIICAENWRIFGQKYMTHANLLYMRKLYIHIRIWFETMSSRMESGYCLCCDNVLIDWLYLKSSIILFFYVALPIHYILILMLPTVQYQEMQYNPHHVFPTELDFYQSPNIY